MSSQEVSTSKGIWWKIQECLLIAKQADFSHLFLLGMCHFLSYSLNIGESEVAPERGWNLANAASLYWFTWLYLACARVDRRARMGAKGYSLDRWPPLATFIGRLQLLPLLEKSEQGVGFDEQVLRTASFKYGVLRIFAESGNWKMLNRGQRRWWCVRETAFKNRIFGSCKEEERKFEIWNESIKYI